MSKRPPNCMNPKNDFVFKRLFGEQETKENLISLLNAILRMPSGQQIADLNVIENKELTKELIEDKTGRLDVRAELMDGTQIDIEMQLTNEKNMDRRTLFYFGKLFLDSVKSGKSYHHLKRTITINLLDFSFLDIERFHSTFHIYEDHVKNYMLTDVLEIHFIEFPKFRKLAKNLSDPLHRWLLFLEEKLPQDQLEELVQMDPVIKKAEERLEWLSSDELSRQLYEARENSLIEYNSKMRDAREEGIELGIEQGLVRGIEQGLEQGVERGRAEVAKNLLKNGMTLANISEVTGLTVEQVKQLAD
jgi:predicted transposase/invertase (TIGR01784 family)